MNSQAQDLEMHNVSGSCCILRAIDVAKRYGELRVLSDVSFSASSGTLTSIVGHSGCGKSTLLSILGGLDRDYQGSIFFDGVSLADAYASKLDAYRSSCVGFVFQGFNLIEHMSAAENIVVALEIDGVPKSESDELALAALEQVGLLDKANSLPRELSGGEIQRVALARAIAKKPKIVLADEPTGSLDSESAHVVASLLRGMANAGACVIIVTHDKELFEPISDQVLELEKLNDSGSETRKTNNPDNECRQVIATKQAEAKGVESRDPSTEHSDESNLERSSISIPSIFSMAISHMRSRVKRVLATLAVCSVGLFGFALLLSLSFGSYDYATDLQNRLLSNIPITIKSDIAIDPDTDSTPATVQELGVIDSDGSFELVVQKMSSVGGSTLSSVAQLIDSMHGEGAGIVSIQKIYPFTNDLYASVDGKWTLLEYAYLDMVNANASQETNTGSTPYSSDSLNSNPTESAFKSNPVFRPLVSSSVETLQKDYTLLGGRYPLESSEVLVVTRPDGTLGDAFLEMLGYSNEVSVDELLQTELALLESCDYLVKKSGEWVSVKDHPEFMDFAISQAQKLTVVGVVAFNYAMDGDYDPGYFGYIPSLNDQVAKHVEESFVVAAQLRSPNVDVISNEAFSVEHGYSEEVLAKLDVSDLSKDKIAYLADLSNVRAKALLRGLGLSEEDVANGEIDALQKNIDEARDATYDSFVNAIDSYAPERLDGGLPIALGKLDHFAEDDIVELRVYVDSLQTRQQVKDKVAEFNELLADNGKREVSIVSSPEIDVFRQAMQIMILVICAFAVMSIVVIFTTMSSTMSTFVFERIREIGCLRSLGMSKRNVGLLFVIESLVIGVFAIAVASVVMLGITGILNAQVQAIMGGSNLFKFDLVTFGLLALVGILLCALASLIPARNAARIDPIKSLRS